MHLLYSEKILIQILRYAPVVLIIILSLSITAYLTIDYTNKIEVNKKEIKENFIQLSKDRVQVNMDTASKYINNQYKTGLKETKDKVVHRVHNAHNIMTGIYNKYKDTKSKKEITEIIKTTLLNIRFDKKNRGYFFIYERTGKNILNAEFRNLEGKNLWNFKDPKGALILQDMYKLLEKQDETFYKWYWPESKGSDKISQKLGFFKKFEPYDWFISTGEYLDYYQNEIETGILTHLQKIKYPDGGYIFVITQDGEVLLSRNNQIDGENILKRDFGAWTKGFKSFIDSSEKTRFVQYTTEFYGDKVDTEKISFLKKLDKNNWVIGTGFHLQKVYQLIDKKQLELEKEKTKYLSNLVIISIVITIILLIISYYFSRYIERLFLVYKKNVEKKNIKLEQAHKIARIGEWELDLGTMKAHWSKSVKEMIGVDQDIDASPAALRKIMHPDDWENFECSLNSCVSSGKEHFVSYRIISPKDGETRWFDCRGQLTDHNTVLGVIQDVTQTKQMQLENDKKQNLIVQQSKMATMGEMINNIAHQWKQPLSTLSMLSGTIRLDNELDQLRKETLEKSLNDIDKSIDYLSQTIDDFRSYFRPQNNKKSKFILSEAVDKTLGLLSYRLKISSIEIVKKMDKIEITSVENQLIQVLINILNNAHDALIENEGIERKLIFINIYREDHNNIIEVYDNAGGISEDILSHIFDAYFTTKVEKDGTGIGLYMSQEILQQLLDASLTVENKEYTYEKKKYRGALFKIELPFK